MNPPERYQVVRVFDSPRGAIQAEVGWAVVWPDTGEAWLYAGALRAQAPTLDALRAQFPALTFNTVDAPARVAAEQAERRAIQEAVDAVERAADAVRMRCGE